MTVMTATTATLSRTDQRMLISDVSKVFATSRGEVQALDHINLEIEPQEFVTLLGTSGCGKSTLLRIIAGLETASTGSVTIAGTPVDGPGPDRGMVFQAYTLFPWLSVLDNIAFGLRQKGHSRRDARKTAQRFIELVGLHGFEDSYTTALSGGMQQRVALARALANDPEVLLLDEPFGALDMQTRETMQDLLLKIWADSPKTVIMVTHDVEEAILLANRVIVMSARPGRVREIIDVDLGEQRTGETRLTEKFLDYKRRATHLLHSNG
jgi:ABC-type nitrate/sulfonate/bicarbonate transport system ATPase subunit